MKKAIPIVAVVAGYCLFEVVLILSIVTPDPGSPAAHTFQMIGFSAQLVLIPGLAAIFSRLIYGRHNWKKRVLTILALGSVGPPVLFGLLVVIGLVFEPIASIKIGRAHV